LGRFLIVARAALPAMTRERLSLAPPLKNKVPRAGCSRIDGGHGGPPHY